MAITILIAPIIAISMTSFITISFIIANQNITNVAIGYDLGVGITNAYCNVSFVQGVLK